MDQTYKRKIRLFSKNNLSLNVSLTLNLEETHYLKIVMRCNIGNVIYLFNDIDGEYEAKIVDFQKKMFVLKIIKKTIRNERKVDLHLIFAPVNFNIFSVWFLDFFNSLILLIPGVFKDAKIIELLT